MKQERFDVGVVVGRFQVPELHGAHLELLEFVKGEHDKVIVFLGVAATRGTRENPLDFEARKQMILEALPKFNVLYIPDMRSDEQWSKKLDREIGHILTPNQTAVLYGGRDSFIERYHGKLPTRELEQAQQAWVSGTAIRREIGTKSAKASADFRHGVVWAAYGDYERVIPTVDVAIFNDDYTKMLMGRKPFEVHYRFIGGFAEPTSATYEVDARREVSEETGVTILEPIYIGSFLIDDWRYRSEVDKIKSLLFGAKYLSGKPEPGDDIEEVRWFDLPVSSNKIVPEHHPLLKAAQAWADTQDNR